jgi:hypothetical protein
VTFNKQSPYSGKTMTVDDYENLGPEEEINL